MVGKQLYSINSESDYRQVEEKNNTMDHFSARRLRRRFLSGLLLLTLLCGTGLFSEALAAVAIRGPYLQLGTMNSIVVRWRTDVPSVGRVLYGQSPTALVESIQGDETTDHEIKLSGLQPDTKYYYAVATSSEILSGGDDSHSFVTSPLVGSAKRTKVWVLGDSGTADKNAAAVRDGYYTYNTGKIPDFWLMLGDNAYTDGTDDEYQEAMFDMYPNMLRQSVVWSTLGNHDGRSADAITQSGAYYDIFTLPTDGAAGGLPSGTESYYSFDYGNIHFVCLESYATDRSADGAMLTWLEQDLASTNQKWIIAFWHHPPYTKGSHDSDLEVESIEMRENALPILENYGVDLVLSGHSHSYERSYLVDGHYGTSDTLADYMILDRGDSQGLGPGAFSKPGDGTTPHEGAVYVVAGSSGKTAKAPLDHPVMQVSYEVLGSMSLDFNGDTLGVECIGPQGEIQDSFRIIKGNAGQGVTGG